MRRSVSARAGLRSVARSRSGIFDNAQQASFTILNDYKPVRAAAGNNTPFSLRVIDSQNVFAAVGVLAIEAARLRGGDVRRDAVGLGSLRNLRASSNMV